MNGTCLYCHCQTNGSDICSEECYEAYRNALLDFAAQQHEDDDDDMVCLRCMTSTCNGDGACPPFSLNENDVLNDMHKAIERAASDEWCKEFGRENCW